MKYIQKVLDNGINIIVVPMLHTKIVSVGFFVGVGSRNETSKNNGIAHFLEHMLFKSTQNYTSKNLFFNLDSLGTIYNAATTMQNTYCYITGNSDDYVQILNILIEIYLNNKFVEKEILSEKKVVLEEMNIRLESILMKLYLKMHKKFFNDGSLGRSVIGTGQNIKSFTAIDLENFKNKWYQPKNTTFVITGNLNFKLVYSQVKTRLSSLFNKELIQVPYLLEKKENIQSMLSQKKAFVYVKKNTKTDQAYVILSFPIYDLYLYKSSEIDLLSRLLSTGFSSRLNKVLREESGITYALTSYPVVYSDIGLFLIQMVLNPLELVNGLKILMLELKKIKTQIVDNEELSKIIKISKNEMLYSLIKPVDILIYFGIGFTSNRNFEPDLTKKIAQIESVTALQLKEIANIIFVWEKINLFICGNTNETNFDFLDL